MTLEYRIHFDSFDQITDLPWKESWGWYEHDTGFDQGLDAPDDQVGLRVGLQNPVTSNGQDI